MSGLLRDWYVEACLCKAFALWAFHESDVWIGSVGFRLRIRMRTGGISGGRDEGGRCLWRNSSETSKVIHGKQWREETSGETPDINNIERRMARAV